MPQFGIFRKPGMDTTADNHRITDVATLERLYGKPAGAAVFKEVDHLHPHYQRMIALSFTTVRMWRRLMVCGPRSSRTTSRISVPRPSKGVLSGFLIR